MAYRPDFSKFMYQRPTYGDTLLPTQQEQSSNQGGINASMGGGESDGILGNIKEWGSGLFGGESLGTSGSMGMGSDAASLAAAESGAGSSATSSGGLGAWGTGGIVAAAIAAQHMMTRDNDREVDGVKTGDAFSGQFGTEPWFAWAGNKMGNAPTAGEKFDAAVKNDDWNKAGGSFNEMTSYWANPTSSWAASAGEGLGLKPEEAAWLSPESKIGKWSDDLFSKWF